LKSVVGKGREGSWGPSSESEEKTKAHEKKPFRGAAIDQAVDSNNSA